MLLYKYVKVALEKARLMPKPAEERKGKINWWVVIASGFVLLTCLLWVWALRPEKDPEVTPAVEVAFSIELAEKRV
jgi:hypothetical protein